jgi:Leucine-rich repeat (LRR) protein
VLACSAGSVRALDPSERSKTVTTALEKTFDKKSDNITATDLAGITELELPHIHIKSFKDGDFAGMTKLKKLYFYSLFHKNEKKKDEVAAFTKGVFAKIPQLEELIIEDDELGTLPDDVFESLKSLKVLELSNTTFTKLPKSLLELPKIEAIYYGGEDTSEEHYEALKKKYGDKLKPKRDGK